jgi:hypothetical protein
LAPRRFAIRRDPVWRPLLVLFGATSGRSYVQIEGDRLSARYGWLFDKAYRLSDIESVRRRGWPFFMGIGWRSNLVNLIGLIGSWNGVVEIRFREKQRGWLILPYSIIRLAISLEEPEAFIDTLGRASIPRVD